MSLRACRLPSQFAAVIEIGRVVIQTDNATQTLRDLTEWAIGHGVELQDLRVAPISLEDVYLELTDEGSGE